MGIIEVNRHGILYAPHTRQYRLKRPDHWFREKECPRCGKIEVLVPYNSYIVLCTSCLKKRWVQGEEMIKDGRAKPFLAVTGRVRCMECGGYSPTLWYVVPGKLCPRCIYFLGGGRGPLKADGVRW